VDAVYIATPPAHHVEYALRVCEAGKPCLIEKPVGRSAGECRRIVEAFRSRDLPLFVSYYRRYLPKHRRVKALLDSGELGDVRSVHYRFLQKPGAISWRHDPARSGGGAFWDIGGHLLDLLEFWLGPLELAGGSAVNQRLDHGTEDTVTLAFRTAAGAAGACVWSFAASHREDRMEIECERGTLRFSATDVASSVTLERPARGRSLAGLASRLRGSKPVHRQRLAFPAPASPHGPMVEAIVASLRGAEEVESDGAGALRVAEMMDAVLSDHYVGRDDAFWERPASWRRRADPRILDGWKPPRAGAIPPERRLSAEQLEQFREHGYLGPFRCTSSALDDLEIPEHGSINLHQVEARTFELCAAASIVDRVEQMLAGDGVLLFKSRYRVKHAGSPKSVVWHQDVGAGNGGLLPDGAPVPSLTVWLALDDATAENGAVTVVPGSHRRLFGDWRRGIRADLRESGALAEIDLDAAVPLAMKAGEFYVFDSWILHSSGANQTRARRAALNMRYVASGHDVESYSPYVVLREPSGGS
jgi:predicted dehydrogenase